MDSESKNRIMIDEEIDGADQRIADHMHDILELLGEDPSREGLLKTPQRVANALQFLTSGYDMDPQQVINGALFECDNDEMVIERDIHFFSLCEHHVLPFFGVCHVAYLPDTKVIGLSKMARVVDVFARRLQIQERMTRQVADCLDDALSPKGVAVVVEGFHMCMSMRGVQKHNAKTITSAMLGDFKDDFRTRSEFLGLIHKHGFQT